MLTLSLSNYARVQWHLFWTLACMWLGVRCSSWRARTLLGLSASHAVRMWKLDGCAALKIWNKRHINT